MQKTLKQAAEEYEAPKLKTVADLRSFNINSEILKDELAKFPYDYIEIKGEKYKVPNPVLKQLKAYADSKFTIFEAKKVVEDNKTIYTVIPIS